MMVSRNLTCLLFNDLESLERSSIEPMIENLSSWLPIETVWVTEAQKRFFKGKVSGDFWVISRNWRRALEFLAYKAYRGGRVFVSVLNTQQEEKNLYRLFFQPFLTSLPKFITLIVHSPMEYHFFRDIKKVPISQLRYAPVAVPVQGKPQLKQPSNKFEVGTFCDFSAESNINFLLAVAHFVCKQNSQIHFNILGRGSLYSHFSKMIHSLGLNEFVSLVETQSVDSVGVLDLFLYVPLRNHHFIPVMLAGVHSLPVLSVELPGVQELILPGETGLLLSSFEVRLMGEKILDLSKNEGLRGSLGRALNQHLQQSFSPKFLNEKYRETFFDVSSVPEKLADVA